ncbi:hypothetical protein [Dyella terrae]|uniref:hypothetical protein n=1 Tax=Dyella terrae TaxID=522259 RepID=UPI001EFDA288|nr:hypothetical protein [Dyella terrae]
MLVIEDETVVYPNVHDALVLGLLLNGDRSVSIPLKTADGQAMCLVLSGVERLKADNFREGNTILSLTVTSSSTLDVGDVAEAYGVAPNDKAFLPQILERLVREKCIAVRINPSFGCALVCVCRDLDVQEKSFFMPRDV